MSFQPNTEASQALRSNKYTPEKYLQNDAPVPESSRSTGIDPTPLQPRTIAVPKQRTSEAKQVSPSTWTKEWQDNVNGTIQENKCEDRFLERLSAAEIADTLFLPGKGPAASSSTATSKAGQWTSGGKQVSPSTWAKELQDSVNDTIQEQTYEDRFFEDTYAAGSPFPRSKAGDKSDNPHSSSQGDREGKRTSRSIRAEMLRDDLRAVDQVPEARASQPSNPTKRRDTRRSPDLTPFKGHSPFKSLPPPPPSDHRKVSGPPPSQDPPYMQSFAKLEQARHKEVADLRARLAALTEASNDPQKDHTKTMPAHVHSYGTMRPTDCEEQRGSQAISTMNARRMRPVIDQPQTARAVPDRPEVTRPEVSSARTTRPEAPRPESTQPESKNLPKWFHQPIDELIIEPIVDPIVKYFTSSPKHEQNDCKDNDAVPGEPETDRQNRAKASQTQTSQADSTPPQTAQPETDRPKPTDEEMKHAILKAIIADKDFRLDSDKSQTCVCSRNLGELTVIIFIILLAAYNIGLVLTLIISAIALIPFCYLLYHIMEKIVVPYRSIRHAQMKKCQEEHERRDIDMLRREGFLA